MNPCLVERLSIMGHIVVCMLERPFQALQLQALQFITACVLDGIASGIRRFRFRHSLLLPYTCVLDKCKSPGLKKPGFQLIFVNSYSPTTWPFMRYERPRKIAIRLPSWLVTCTS